MKTLLSTYTKCFVVEVDNVRSNQLQKTRISLRGKAEILMGINTMMRKVIKEFVEENSELEIISKLGPLCRGNVGFVFTNGNLSEVREILETNVRPAPARVGSLAPIAVVVPKGPTGCDPGQTAFFQTLQIGTKITKGQIEIVNDVSLIAAGNKVTASQAALLQKLDIEPFSYGLVLLSHISQWNDNYYDNYDVRILTKRLVRFRLCPISSCSDVKSAGCTSKYGDYVVDMNTFVYYYLQAQVDEEEYKCTQIYNSCSNSCENQDDDCMLTCYANAGLASCRQNDDDGYSNSNFEAIDFAQCSQYAAGDDDGSSYYIGPYCADQGGEIHLGLFSDDSCTVTTSNSKSTFYYLSGYELPYSSSSVIPTTCMTCLEYSQNYYDDGYQAEENVKEICSNIYSASGKCESKMSVNYPNESACTYIEGIKIIREDGVIRTSTKRKSKAAAVSIGIFTSVAVLLGGYVYYLRTKLGRAKINLSPPGAMLS